MSVMAPVQIGTADDHAICHKGGQQAVEFYGRGMRLTACVISGSLIAGFIHSYRPFLILYACSDGRRMTRNTRSASRYAVA